MIFSDIEVLDRRISKSARAAHNDKKIAAEVEFLKKVVATQMMIEALRNAMSKLNKDEREIIERLYFNDETLRAVSKTQNISHTALIKRRDKILEKLKKFIEEI